MPPSIQSMMIKPSTKHARVPLPSIKLHQLDIANPVHISNHRYFHPPTVAGNLLSLEDVVKSLQDSLAEALELYPPVAGVVRFNETTGWVISCDNENYDTPFIVQKIEKTFAEVGDADEIVSPRPKPFLETPAPVLAVKLTQFSCNTIAVCTSMHHMATDLSGFVDFLHLWSTICRGKPVDFTRIPTDWSRNPSRFFVSPDAHTSHETKTPTLPGYTVLSSSPTPDDLPVFRESEAQKWTLSTDDLKRLKEDLSPKSPNQGWISSSDALSALFWGAITRARHTVNLSSPTSRIQFSNQFDMETLALAADGRERVSHSNKHLLKAGYLGNLNLLFITSSPRVYLLSTSTESISNVALAIRTSLSKQLNPSAAAARIKLFEDSENITPPTSIVWAADTIGTNWSGVNFQSEEMSFGWGKPFETTSGGGPLPGGFFRIMKAYETSTFKVLVGIDKEAAEAFREDVLMKKYAKFECVVPTSGKYE